MEVVAGLGLACNVIQVVGFAFQVVEICTDLYNHGTTVEIQSINDACVHLKQAVAPLEVSLSAPRLHGPTTKRDIELAELSGKVQAVADSLGQELKQFQINPRSKIAFGKAIRLKARARRIERSRKRLKGYAKVLETKILVYIRQDIETLKLQQVDVFQSLDDRQREIASELAKGATTIKQIIRATSDQTNRHVTQEHLATRSRIDVLDKKLDSLLDNQAQIDFDRFLEALDVPEINRAHRAIENAHHRRLEWIFEKHHEPCRSLSCLADWLRSDDSLFWILGKFGSGKTTLMNRLVQDGRTQEALDSNGRSTLILSFSFWNGGVDLQKFQVGFLQSLIVQLLSSIGEQRLHQIWVDMIRPHTRNWLQEWNDQRLLSFLRQVIETDKRRMCLFLDGLDEYRDEVYGSEAMTGLFDLFMSRRYLKMCVSSRPRVDLKPLYATCPKIIMQAVNEPDVRRYVNDELSKMLAAVNGNSAASQQASQLVEMAVAKAKRGFLWAKLAVELLRRGINNEDSLDDLKKRLDLLPERLPDLYPNMWQSMVVDQPIYDEEATFYLRAVERFKRLSLIEAAILTDDDLHLLYSTPVDTWGIPQLEAIVQHERAVKRITTCCAGFLEVTDADKDDIDEVNHLFGERLRRSIVGPHSALIRSLCEYSHVQQSTFVNFVHRTAAEYLRTPGKPLSQECRYPERDFVDRYLTSVLIAFTLTPPTALSWEMYWRFQPIGIPLLDSQQAVTFLSRLEEVCKKLFEWRIWTLEQSDFPRESQPADDIDYAKVFMMFGHVDYIRKKLHETGRIHDTEYLTRLLRWWAWTSVRYLPFEEIIPNCLLLLRLGAHPNQSILDTKEHPLTISLFLMYAILSDVGLSDSANISMARELINALLKADADPNGQLTCVLEKDTGGLLWKETWKPNLSRAFILSKWSARDMLNSSPDLSDSTVQHLLDRFGAVSAERRSVWFEPPNTWRVLSDNSIEACELVENWDYGPDHGSSDFYFSIDDKTLLETLECDKGKCHAFTSGVTAFRVAGWTDDEIRNEPCLQSLWVEIERSSKRGRPRSEGTSSPAMMLLGVVLPSSSAVTV